MIKLQLLLRHPGKEPELDPALRARLEACGMAVTGAGRASLSAEIGEDGFDKLFGHHPALQSGFAPTPQASMELPVPASLSDAISLITVAPRHSATNHHPRNKTCSHLN